MKASGSLLGEQIKPPRTVVPGWSGKEWWETTGMGRGVQRMGEDAGLEAESYKYMKGGDKGRGEQLRKCFQQDMTMKYLKRE